MDRVMIRKLILCIVVFGICLIPAFFINTIYGYLPVLMVSVLLIGSYVYMRLLRKSLSYEEHSDLGSCTRGTKIDFSIDMKNRSILFYPLVEPYFYISDLFGEDDTLTSDIITLAPKEKRNFGFDARFDHIGTYSAGLRKIRLQDMLGLFTHTIVNDKEYTVSVVPQIYDIEKLPVSMTAVSESQKMTVSNPMDASDYAGVREYVIGDPIKNIHWKLSARTTGYMTKVFESYSNTGICTILDFHAPQADPSARRKGKAEKGAYLEKGRSTAARYDADTMMSIFDCIVETALSVGRYAVKEGLESEIRYYDKHGEKIQINSYEKESFTDMMKGMPRIHAEPDVFRAVDLLREEGNSLYSQGNLAICTSDITGELIETLVGIRSRRKNPMLFAVVPENMEEEEKRTFLAPLRALEGAGIWYHVLSDASSLEGGDLS